MSDDWKTGQTGLGIVYSTYPLEFCHPLPAVEQHKKKIVTHSINEEHKAI